MTLHAGPRGTVRAVRKAMERSEMAPLFFIIYLLLMWPQLSDVASGPRAPSRSRSVPRYDGRALAFLVLY